MELADIREAAGHNGQELADLIGWDQSKVSRIENGKQSIDEVDLVTWLLACKIKAPRLRQIVKRNQDAIQDTWVLPYGTKSSDSRNVIVEEREAKTITVYDCLVVPALLQTPEYTRVLVALFHAGDEVNIERIRSIRGDRQHVLRGARAPHAVFYIEEAVLRRPIGDERIIHDQLMRLMFMADWTKVSIRVLPTALGEHAALGGPFTLIGRRDKRWVACVNTQATSVMLESTEHIDSYKNTVKDLAARALSEEESRAFIAALADEFGSPREDPDDTAGGLA